MKTRFMFCLLIVFVNLLGAQHISTPDHSLTLQHESIIKIASYTAQGDLENLKISFHDGLDNKLTVNQIK